MFPAFPSPNNCFYPVAHNSSYGYNDIKYTYRKGSSTYSKYAYYREAFKEKTNSDLGIACSGTGTGRKTCYVGCECASGWSNGTAPSTGEYVWATDTRYAGGLSSMSANGSLSSMSANGNLSTMSGNYSISTMGSNGGMTCYKKACPNGGYLDEPGSAFTKSRSDGTLGLDCWNATGCSSYYASNASGTKYEYHGTVCYRKTCADGGYSDKTQSGKHCSPVSYAGLQCYACEECEWACPDDYDSSKCGTGYYQTGTSPRYCVDDHSQTSGTCYACEKCEWTCPDGYESSCGSGYYQTGTANNYCNGDSSQTNGLCYKCTKCPTTVTCGSDEVCTAYSPCDSSKCTSCRKKSCEEGGYFSSTQSGKHCSPKSYASKTCYDCHTPDYTWCPDGYQQERCGTGYHQTDTKEKECQHCSRTSGTCYKCEANTCEYYGYKSSQPSGQTCTPVEITSGYSVVNCYKDCEEITCPDGYFAPLENISNWNYVQQFMNLEDLNGEGRCFKPLSCKEGYHNKDDLISNYTDYYYPAMPVTLGDLTCIDGRCWAIAVDENGREDSSKDKYFETADKDLGDGLKCLYATGCKYPYSTNSNNTCGTGAKVATSRNGITCYDSPYYNSIIDVTAYTTQTTSGAVTSSGQLSQFGIGASGNISGNYSASMSIDGGDSWSGNNLSFGNQHRGVKEVERIARATVTSFSINGMSCSPSSATHDCSVLDCTYNAGTPGEGHQTFLVRFLQDVSQTRVCPPNFYHEEPDGNVFDYDGPTSGGNYQITGCYRVTDCNEENGYTKIDNGTEPITYEPQNFSCYKSEDKYYDVTITPIIKQSVGLDGGTNEFYAKWSLAFEMTSPKLDSAVFFPVWEELKYNGKYGEKPIVLLPSVGDPNIGQIIKEYAEVEKICNNGSAEECTEADNAFTAEHGDWNVGGIGDLSSKPEQLAAGYCGWFYKNADNQLDNGTYCNDGGSTASKGGIFLDSSGFGDSANTSNVMALPEYRSDVTNQICDWIKKSSSAVQVQACGDESCTDIIISTGNIKWGDCIVETEEFPRVASSGTTPCSEQSAFAAEPFYGKKPLYKRNIAQYGIGDNSYKKIRDFTSCCTNGTMTDFITIHAPDDNCRTFNCSALREAGCTPGSGSVPYMEVKMQVFIGSIDTAFTWKIEDENGNIKEGENPMYGQVVAVGTQSLPEAYLAPGKYTLTITTTGTQHTSCSTSPAPVTIDFVITGQNEYEYLFVTPNKCLANDGYAWSQ